MSQVAGVLGVWRGDRMLTFYWEFVYYFGLADVVTSTSHCVHISGKVFELVPIVGYFIDGYTWTRVSIGAMHLSYLEVR